MAGIKALVAIMTLLIAVCLGLLAYGLVAKTAPQPGDIALSLPGLSRVEHVSAWKDGVALYVATPKGDFIYFVDPARGVTPTRVQIKRAAE